MAKMTVVTFKFWDFDIIPFLKNFLLKILNAAIILPKNRNAPFLKVSPIQLYTSLSFTPNRVTSCIEIP